MDTDTDSDTELAKGTFQRSGSAEPAPQVGPGTLLAGRYRLERELGQGAMGKVYLARHEALGIDVAVKVLKHDVRTTSDEYTRRFQREARATSHLDHPNVVRVLDYGEEPARYIVMEFIQGQTLAQYLDEEQAPPPLGIALAITRQIVSALKAAHGAGIIHRDLKPDNVLLTWREDEPVVKVVDFGLAHFDDEFDHGPTLTQQGVVAGTPAYMSPEQCQSMAVTPSSDLYSVGCVLTELLQLTPPFSGDSAAVLMSQQMFVPPPPLLRPSEAEAVPAWLEQLRLELLQKQAHKRPASAGEVALRIDQGDEPESTPRTTERGSLTGKTPTPTPAAVTHHLTVGWLGTRTPDAATRTGLSIHNIAVEAGDGPRILIIDASQEDAGLTEQLGRAHSEQHRVILLLKTLSAKDLPRLIESGADDVIKAPVDPIQLCRAIRRIERRVARQERDSQ